MTIKQVQSVGGNLAAVASVAIAASVVNSYFDGELVDWAQFPHILRHASLFAVVCMFGWIVLKSPWAPQVRELIGLMSTKRETPAGTETTMIGVNIKTEAPACAPVAPIGSGKSGRGSQTGDD